MIAVSGGPDSVALLRAILAIRPPTESCPVVLAHLNHRLRGSESDGDEAFVRSLHAELATTTPQLHLSCHTIDVADRAQAAGDNVEKVARQLRYAWLSEVVTREQCTQAATGHTADDQAETVLHRLIRGTGMRGLRGIARRRPLCSGVRLIRPLLRVTRMEVLGYLQALGQTYRSDSSNHDRRFTRNRIRHELLPVLRDFNPRIDAVLCRLSEQAAAVHRRTESQARRLLQVAERARAGGLLIFDRPRLAAAPRGLVREALRLAWRREGWPENGMSFAGWDRLADLVFAESGAIDLPGGVRACNAGRVVQLGRHS